jgi:tetratricopeptide (TPR) repeat protein
MKRQIDALTVSLREFIAQPDYPTLVLDGSDASLVFPVRILAALDRQDDDHYYLLFPEPCGSASVYVDGILRSLAAQIEIFNAELAARQLPRWPQPPLEAGDSRQPPARRLEAIIRYMGRHLPGDEPIVWGLLPGELTDTAGYHALIGALLIPNGVPPWMERHRFLLRDQRAAPEIVPRLEREKNDIVLIQSVELDGAQAMHELAATAQDTGLPADERMQAFFQLAAVDHAFQRYPEALEKYGASFNYYQSSGNAPMQALCLTSAGDTLLQVDRPEDALVRYQQSLAISVEDGNVPVMHAGAYGAGTACLRLGQDADAEGYLKHASDLAGKMSNPFSKCEAMEKLGIARYRQGKLDEAIDVWIKGKDLAKQFGDEARAKAILDHLIMACQQAGLVEQQREHEREHASLARGSAGQPEPERSTGA